MGLWNRLLRSQKAESGNEISDLPKFWQWVENGNPIEQFTGIGMIEMVFRNHPEAVGGQEYRRSVGVLKGILNGRSKALQAEAITVLALIKARDALPEINQKTDDPNANVREKAILARDKLR